MAIAAVGPAQAVNAGQPFSVYINLSPNNAIAGVQFSLSFNPSLMMVNGVVEGDLLRQSGASTYFMPGRIDNSGGSVSGIAGAIVSPGKTVSSSGTFAVVTMTAKSGPGTSPLGLSSVIVGDVNGKAMPADIVSGQVVISATNSPPPAPTTGGGDSGVSGFAGGGGGAFAIPGVTNLTIFTNSEGVFSIPAAANSEDGKAKLKISQGVQARTRDGGPLRSISVSQTTDATALSAGPIMAGSAYDFGPDGAVFSAPVALSINYDPSLLPKGLTEKNLTIGSWDQAAGRWIENNSTVDPSSRSVTANISHFSRYAVITHVRPAAFTTGDLEISPNPPMVNEPVTIRVKVNNTGDAGGSHDVILNLSSGDESEILKQTVQVAGEASREVEFTVTRQSPGSFTVTVDDLSGSFMAVARPIPDTTVPPVYSAGSSTTKTIGQILEEPADPPAVVSWYVLMLTIGASALAAAVTTAMLLRRRVALLGSWAPDGAAVVEVAGDYRS